MENSFQTSFIPKKPIIDNGLVSSRKDKTVSITMVVTVAILVIMIAASGGLYLYKGYLQKNKDQLSTDLFKIRDSFNKDTIAELEMYDKRSTVAKDILGKHIVLSPLFEVINELTLSSIQYTKFEHSTDNGVFNVKMSGIARDYKSIALQADVYNTGRGRMFKDLIFSNLTKNKNNYVTFDVEFTVDPALLSYSNNITNGKTTNTNTNTNTNTQAPVNNTPEPSTSVVGDNSGQPLQVNNGIQ